MLTVAVRKLLTNCLITWVTCRVPEKGRGLALAGLFTGDLYLFMLLIKTMSLHLRPEG